MAVDLGGPINKVAYTFAVAAISNGNYYPMAAAMVGGVVPPLGVALATTLFKSKFTKDQHFNIIFSHTYVCVCIGIIKHHFI